MLDLNKIDFESFIKQINNKRKSNSIFGIIRAIRDARIVSDGDIPKLLVILYKLDENIAKIVNSFYNTSNADDSEIERYIELRVNILRNRSNAH